MIDVISCPRCAREVTGEGRFCANCGSDLRSPTADAPFEATPDRLLIESLRRATIGEYEIREELGRGGMATVFLAHDIRLQKKVAIKVLSPHLQLVPGMATRFLREAQTAAAMEHPNIIPIYAYRETAEFAFFTMRYVDGASLSAVAKQIGQLPIPAVRALLWDIGSALACAHAHGVLHRDVKPGNVLLGRDGSVVVTDFGIAKQADGHSVTMTGQLLGTPAYMSPEQCRGTEIGFSSDQYALGVMAFELVAGRLPFLSDAAGGYLALHLTEPAPNILDFRPDCPPDLARAIMRMLQKTPSERFDSVHDALTAAGAAAVLPTDPARLQITAWAQNPTHVRSFADTPLSPVIGTLPAPPRAPIAAEPAPAVAPPPAAVVASETASQVMRAGKTPRWLLFSPALLGAMVAVVILVRHRAVAAPSSPPAAPQPGSLVVASDTATHPAEDSAAHQPVNSAALPDVEQAMAVASPAATAAQEAPRRGVLVVSGLPARGRIIVDGRARTGARLELEPGRHAVRLVADGYQPVESVVQVSAGATSAVVFAANRITAPEPAPTVPTLAAASSASGVLMLRVRPFARVFVDGVFKSEDELLVLSLRDGRHVLRFEKPGYAPLDATVTVTAGDTLKKLFTLQPETP